MLVIYIVKLVIWGSSYFMVLLVVLFSNKLNYEVKLLFKENMF